MSDNHHRRDGVGIIDDDADVREAVSTMLVQLGSTVFAYPAAREYLEDPRGRSCCACLILDVRLPGISGLQLQRQLRMHSRTPAIIFISGCADTASVVEAMRNGAVDFLEKPFGEQRLLDSVQVALALEQKDRHAENESDRLAEARARLTPREHEVLARVLVGMRAKEIASELGIATKTAEEHRSRVMRKLQTPTVAKLVSMFH